MSFADDANAIRSRFATEWPPLRPTVPVAYDNAAFDPAADARDADGDPAPWVRLTIIPGDGFQASLGTPRVWRSTGLVTVQVFVPLGQGDGLARELADDVAGLFRGVSLSGLIFRAPSLTRIGADGAWYQINVATPYQADLCA
jgi:hypothetical protein